MGDRELPATETLEGGDRRDERIAPATPGLEADPVAVGDRVGRYLLDARIGAGGMGVVYRATDEVLQRAVALKLLHTAGDPDLARRLVREARVAARLHHPNVVAIHEVGSASTGPFIAMEYIEGETVDRWLEASSRSWRDVVAVFRDAGRGVVAAHEAGVIHRDLKPSNILVARDGRVVVADFGIAHVKDTPSPTAAPIDAPADVAPVTRAAGTPRYAAPEQLAGAPCDERSDLYSFCVALYECLYGEPPSRDAAGTIGTPEHDPRGVPAWLRATVVSRLAVDPDDRDRDLGPLLRELARDPARTRRRIVIGAVAASAFAAAGAIAVLVSSDDASATPRCEGMASQLDGVWDDEVRADLATAFAATSLPYSEDIARGVGRELDHWREAWIATRREACEATHVRGDQSSELLELRMRCLDARRRNVAAVTSRLRTADSKAVDRAVNAVAQVTTIACDDPDTLRAAFPLPDEPVARGQVEAVEVALADVEGQWLMGDVAGAGTRASELVTRATQLGHLPLEAATLWTSALIERDKGDHAASAALLRRLIRVASRGRDDRLVARGWLTLMFVVGNAESWTRALDLEDAATAAVTRAGDPIDLRAHLANQLGLVHGKLGHEADARAHLEESVVLGEQALGPDSILLSSPLNNLGSSLLRAGEFDAAARHLRRAIEIRTQYYGALHPALMSAYTNLGLVFMRQGRYDDALPYLERVLAVRERVLPPSHPHIGDAHINVAANHFNRNDLVAATRHIEAALAVFEQQPAGGVTLAKARQLAGTILIATGDAAAGHRRCREAIAELDRLDVTSEHRVAALMCLGEAELALARPRDALAHLETASALEAKLGKTVAATSHTRALLARTLWANGRRREAIVEAKSARATMAGPRAKELDARLAAWIAEAGDPSADRPR
ncbi:MAG: tetratricopeptide repeat protein [Kofleriaceae bacterium]